MVFVLRAIQELNERLAVARVQPDHPYLELHLFLPASAEREPVRPESALCFAAPPASPALPDVPRRAVGTHHLGPSHFDVCLIALQGEGAAKDRIFLAVR